MIFDWARNEVTVNAISSGSEANRERTGIASNTAPLAADQTHGAVLDQLWHSHAQRLLRTTYHITRNRQDAEDALQDAFLRAFMHFSSFDGRASISTWLTRIAINSALMILRKRGSSSELSFDSADGEDEKHEVVTVVDCTPDPEAQFVQCERERLLRQAVQMLRPSLRRAIELQKLQEHSIKETAAITGQSVPTTKSQVHHAKAAIRELLAAKFVATTAESSEVPLQSAA